MGHGASWSSLEAGKPQPSLMSTVETQASLIRAGAGSACWHRAGPCSESQGRGMPVKVGRACLEGYWAQPPGWKGAEGWGWGSAGRRSFLKVTQIEGSAQIPHTHCVIPCARVVMESSWPCMFVRPCTK